MAAICAAFSHTGRPNLPRGRTSSPKPAPLCQGVDDRTRSLPLPIAVTGRARDDSRCSGLPSPTSSTPSYFFDFRSAASSYRPTLPSHSGSTSPVRGALLSRARSRASSVDRHARVRDHQRQMAQQGSDLDNPPVSPLNLPVGDAPHVEPWPLASPLSAAGLRRSLDLPGGGARRTQSRAQNGPMHAKQQIRGFDAAPTEANQARGPAALPMQRGHSSYGAGAGSFEVFSFEQDAER